MNDRLLTKEEIKAAAYDVQGDPLITSIPRRFLGAQDAKTAEEERERIEHILRDKGQLCSDGCSACAKLLRAIRGERPKEGKE